MQSPHTRKTSVFMKMPSQSMLRNYLKDGESNDTPSLSASPPAPAAMQPPKKDITTNVEQLQKSFGTNWEMGNIGTLTDWIWIGAHNIKMLTLAIQRKRSILRVNAMIGILLSTLTGTLSISQYNTIQNNTYFIILLSTLSFLVAVSSGYMKINQVQETLEEFIKIKQQWVFFTTIIFSEFQLPIHLRQDALYLIWKYKNQYLDLLKIDLDIPASLRTQAEVGLQIYLQRFQGDKVVLNKFNNFLSSLLDMPKEAGFSTHLPNLMLDAIVLYKPNRINPIKAPKKNGTTVESATGSEAATTSAATTSAAPTNGTGEVTNATATAPTTNDIVSSNSSTVSV